MTHLGRVTGHQGQRGHKQAIYGLAYNTRHDALSTVLVSGRWGLPAADLLNVPCDLSETSILFKKVDYN